MMNPVKIVGMVVPTAALLAFVAFFGGAHSPAYSYFAPKEALLKVSISHASQRKDACHKRTAEELAALPPNMRSAQQCSRERVPVLLEVDIDGTNVMKKLQQPSGLSKDGASAFYHTYRIPSGTHKMSMRMRDSARAEGFDYVQEQTVEIKPHDVVVIEFIREEQRFTVQ